MATRTAHELMLSAADACRTTRDQLEPTRLIFKFDDFTSMERAAYYHGKQDAYEHSAQIVRQYARDDS